MVPLSLWDGHGGFSLGAGLVSVPLGHVNEEALTSVSD